MTLVRGGFDGDGDGDGEYDDDGDCDVVGDDDPGDGVAGDVEVSGGRDSRRLLSRLQSKLLNLRRWR